jgi:hypothetical protein
MTRTKVTNYEVLGTQIRRYLICTFCLVAAPAYGASTLITEFSYDSGLQFVPGSELPNAVNFSFSTSLLMPESFTHWGSQHTPGDIGKTLLASPDVVGGVAAATTNPKVVFVMSIGPDSGRFGGYDDLMPPTGEDLGILRMKLFVPNPTDYHVTSIERAINNVILRWVPNGEGSYYHIGGMQTVRLFGVMVPEPSVSALLFAAGCFTFLNRH